MVLCCIAYSGEISILRNGNDCFTFFLLTFDMLMCHRIFIFHSLFFFKGHTSRIRAKLFRFRGEPQRLFFDIENRFERKEK